MTQKSLTSMVDGVGTTFYTYDAAGQILSEDGPWADDTVSYTYANRLRTGMSLAAGGSPQGPWSQSYGYDAVRRLTSVTSPAGEFDYQYFAADPSTLVEQLTLPNDAVITNGYDAVARLTRTELMNSSGADLDSYGYGYNQAGQRTNVVRTLGDYVNYTYDNMGELKTAKGKEAGGTSREQEQLGYAYDAAGNLNQRTNNALIQAFNVNSLNELNIVTRSGLLTAAGTTTVPATHVTVNGSPANRYADATFTLGGFTVTNGANTFTAIGWDGLGDLGTNTVTVNLPATNNFAYDLNGNLVSDGKRNFAYDDENELISVWVANAWSNSFAYDGKMRRRIEREYTWQFVWVKTNETRFIYDGNLVVQERNTNNQPVVTYTRGDDLSGTLQGAGGIGGLLARSAHATVVPWYVLPGGGPLYTVSSYYHADGNGNITMLLDASQNVVAKYLYDPFGNTLAQSGPLADANTYRFSSKEWNANAGLYYYLYRFYDPSLQRWVNRDPILEWGGINLYEFIHNNPLRYVDKLGLQITLDPPDFPEDTYGYGDGGNLGKTTINDPNDLSDIDNEWNHLEPRECELRPGPPPHKPPPPPHKPPPPLPWGQGCSNCSVNNPPVQVSPPPQPPPPIQLPPIQQW